MRYCKKKREKFMYKELETALLRALRDFLVSNSQNGKNLEENHKVTAKKISIEYFRKTTFTIYFESLCLAFSCGVPIVKYKVK